MLVSPSMRARETCELCGLGDVARERADLHEWDYGDYEGLTSAEIQKDRPGWNLWRDGCPGGERAGDVGERADRVIAELRAHGRTAAVFSHGHMLRVLGARWIALGPEHGGRWAFRPPRSACSAPNTLSPSSRAGTTTKRPSALPAACAAVKKLDSGKNFPLE